MDSCTVVSKAGRKEWIGLAVLALPCLLYSMDLTVLNLAVPHLSADLKPTNAQLLWIVDIYGFVLAGGLMTMGTLGDRIGRRRLLLFGAAFFGLASIIAAFSTSPAMLIAARALLGLSAATLAPSTLSLLRNMFHDDKERGFAIGIWVASFSAGAALGPVIGGVLLNYFWWGSVFLVSVPVMLLLLAVGPSLLPEFRDPQAGRLDVISAGLSIVAVLSIVFGIKQTAELGLNWTSSLTILAGLLVGYVFILRQRTIVSPMVDLSLFGSTRFSAAVVVNVAAFFIAFGSFLFIAQYLQLVLGLSPMEAGLWSMPSGLAFGVASIAAASMAARFRPAFLMAGGSALAMAGFLLLAWAAGENSLILTVLAYVLISLGLGPVFALTTDLIVGAVSVERAGMASGIAETSSEFGGALGIAVLGSIVSAVYRSVLERPAPGDVPVTSLETARDTLGAALETARALPAQIGDALAASARVAYVDGLVVICFLCAAVAFGIAVLSVSVLRAKRQ